MPNLRNDATWVRVLVCLALVLGVTLPGGASGADNATRHEWVFVDTTVAGYQDLVDDVLAGGDDGRHIELVLLDGRRDGLAQIAEALAGRSSTDAIHLITHGSQAALALGTTRLTTDSMLGAHADALSEIGRALTEDGDILVYGCDFGQGSLGRQAAGWLATLSGADVAASDDLTGAQALGGDWELEVRTGYVETAVAFSTEVQQDWFGVLQNTAPYFGPTSFIPHTITTAADAAYSVTTADLDGDGDLDVLSASWLDDTIAWYENDGSQNFTAHTITTAADVAVSVTTADLDGDGDLDVLSASEDDDTIAWYENDGSENFTAHTISTAAEGTASVTTADLDGDGDLDVLSASWRDDTIAWYENDGSQNFTAQTITTAADAAVSVTTADLDGDGDLDVLSASENDDTIAWYENDGSENFTAHTITTAADEPTSVTVADVDG